MTKLYSTPVPYEGPEKDYKILIVGEAPGAEEIGQGRPFVGKAGQLLERYIERNGSSRAEVRLANLCNYRPEDNKFIHCLNTPQLEEGLEKLEEEIKRNHPNVVIATGGWPMYFLTGKATKEKNKTQPGSGVLTYRGSRLPAVERFGGESQKVFITMHPSFILRSWKMNPVFNIDLEHAVEDSHFPELNYPIYEEHIDPDRDVLYDLVHQAISSEWISIDIETFPGGRYSCVGFSFRNKVGSDSSGIRPRGLSLQKDNNQGDIGVCITYQRPDLARFAQDVWESSTPKIFQYGTYDINFMRHFYGWKVGGYYNNLGWDTYVASASILPDYPRGLDFLNSIYTRLPYYKTERKVWKEAGDLNILWRYNIKDCVATYQIAMTQMEEIKQLFKKRRVA